MVDKKKINHESVSNPRLLRKVLEAMDTEIDSLRTLANELRTDHGSFRTYCDNMKTALRAMTHNAAGLAASSSAKKMKFTNNIVYTVGGKAYTKSAAASITFTADSHDLDASDFGWYLVTVNASGSVAVSLGSVDSSASSATIPALPPGQAPIGLLFGKGGTGGFDATTESISHASGLASVAFYDILIHPTQASGSIAIISASAVTEQTDKGK